jgi:putative ABC transport system permease protein
VAPRRAKALFRRRRLDAELDEQFAYHLDQKAQEYVARGLGAGAARTAALRDMHGVDQRREECRDMRKVNFVENFVSDARYALRMLLHSPGFSITAILALALGIGANTAIFSVVNTVLLQPLPYAEPDRLVELELSGPQGNGDVASVTKYNVWKEQKQAFEAVAAYGSGPGVNLMGGDRPEQLKALRASAEFFDVFRVPVEIGRAYTKEEDIPDGPKLAVLSSGLWRNHFGSDKNIVGKTIQLGDEAYVVSGVLSPSFLFDPPTDIYIPFQADPNSTDQSHFFQATARLNPGVTIGMAQAAMKQAAEEFKRKFPGAMNGQGQSFTALPLRETVVGDVRTSLLVLLGAVGCVLLIACANVANLLLARATIRRREIAIRAALGAGRGRIISQLLTESVMLSLAAGLLGLVLGYFGVHGLLAMNPGNIPRIGEYGASVSMDWRVLVFTLAVAIFTGLLFGLIPAFGASKADLNVSLRESGSRSGSGLRQNKARSVLVVAETALALILLVGAALLIRTFAALRGVDPGFSTHNVLTMNMSLTGPRFSKTLGVAEIEEQMRQRVEAVPGVEAMSTTCCLPLEGGLGLPFTIEGRPAENGPYHGGAGYDIVSWEYFSVFRIPLKNGRMFTVRDDGAAPGVVLISESMAKQYWPKGDAVGQRITIGKGVGPEFAEPPREIIGIVGDARNGGLDNDPPPIMYVPVAQIPDGVTALNSHITPLQIAVLTKVNPFSLSREIEVALRESSGGMPVAHIRSMDQVRSESTARSDFNMTLLTIFAGVALLLASIGIYGLMAYTVQQRTQEIGIRMALGASPGKVRTMVVRQGMLLALLGVVTGVAAAVGLSRYMKTLVFGVKTSDPLVFVSVAVVLSVVALLATYVPAVRASRVDPIVSLRYE